jgi:glycosyltransferase involved in cell wall biosynthesis
MRVAICAAGEIWGGVERFVATFALALRDRGADVTVILFHERQLAARVRECGVDVDVITGTGKYDIRQLHALQRLLRARRIDLVHVHGYRATIAGSLAARRCGIPVVKTEHGRFEAPAGSTVTSGAVRMGANLWLDRVATRWLVRSVAFVSHDLRRSFGARPGPRGREVIHNAVEPLPAAPGVPGAVQFADAQFHIGIVGRLAAVKGQRYAIDAMARLGHAADLRLHLFGAGPLEAACRQQSRDAALGDRVIFHGFRDDIAACLRGLHLFVMPSAQEGLPYALLEAMQAGLPIVASDLPGIREVLPRGEADGGILVPPRDAVALADAIERLRGDRALRLRLGESAARRVREAFLLDRMVDRYVRFFEGALAHAS